MLLNAACRADEAGLKALIDTTPPVLTEYCCTTPPTSKVFAPASETASESAAVLPLRGFKVSSKSAQRPPQPVVGGRSGIDVCHCVTWSLCEKSCGGFATLPLLYCALVSG